MRWQSVPSLLSSRLSATPSRTARASHASHSWMEMVWLCWGRSSHASRQMWLTRLVARRSEDQLPKFCYFVFLERDSVSETDELGDSLSIRSAQAMSWQISVRPV